MHGGPDIHQHREAQGIAQGVNAGSRFEQVAGDTDEVGAETHADQIEHEQQDGGSYRPHARRDQSLRHGE